MQLHISPVLGAQSGVESGKPSSPRVVTLRRNIGQAAVSAYLLTHLSPPTKRGCYHVILFTSPEQDQFCGQNRRHSKE
jgi:hypothetical protein